MKKKNTGTKRHILLILILILTGILLLYKEFEKERLPLLLPQVAIVMDDLGVSKHLAEEVLDINAPITLSILPHETYTKWIAEKGHRKGHEIIAHVPMEAKEPYHLGKGGLHRWMTEDEIKKTLDDALNSIPHIIGVNNHMGSAFTEDERAMGVVLSEIGKRGLFFLDSLTSSGSVGMRLSKAHRVKAIKRDIFLDDEDDPLKIKDQWERLVRIAKKDGYAIALAHPRQNTIRFLKGTASRDKRVRIVPISSLLP